MPKWLLPGVLNEQKTVTWGDVKPVGAGVSEMSIDIGAGYRVYYTMREKIMVILLAGATKSTQQTDIKKAIELAKEF